MTARTEGAPERITVDFNKLDPYVSIGEPVDQYDVEYLRADLAEGLARALEQIEGLTPWADVGYMPDAASFVRYRDFPAHVKAIVTRALTDFRDRTATEGARTPEDR